MKRKNNLLALSLLFFAISFAQKKVYIDENMKEIDSVRYFKKCNAHILKCLVYKKDSLSIHKVLFKYSFGKITAIETKQLQNYLHKKTHLKTNQNGFIIIHFKDTLYNFNIINKNYLKHLKNHSGKRIKHRKFNSKIYFSKQKKWEKKQKRCLKKIQKKNIVSVFYAYKERFNGATNEYPSTKWIKDEGIIRNHFFKLTYKGFMVVVKPNGEYLVIGGHFHSEKLKLLLKNKDWTVFKNQWKKSYNTLHKYGYGIFGNTQNEHKNECF